MRNESRIDKAICLCHSPDLCEHAAALLFHVVRTHKDRSQTHLAEPAPTTPRAAQGNPGASISQHSIAPPRKPDPKKDGWNALLNQPFDGRIVQPQGDWIVDLAEENPGWFLFDLGIYVDGVKYSLLPILSKSLGLLSLRAPLEELERFKHHESFLFSDRRRAIYFPAGFPYHRIAPDSFQLFDKDLVLNGGQMRISVADAAEIARMHEEPGIEIHESSTLHSLRQKLRSFRPPVAVATPPRFNAELREYQMQGVGWLQFIREFQFGGILADDMGLGKTVQTLAHLLIEQQAGRLSKPALVISPTSVLPNWLAESTKLAPDLNVLVLHGADRKRFFSEISKADLVLSTYPLVTRDFDDLKTQCWSAVILDESQMIKNYKSLASQNACKLQSDYRVCLTGTPVENHLGELWSQFRFLMPQLLEDHGTFTNNFRNPIERDGDLTKQWILTSRLRPFMLRRTKESVEKELPPKTEIIRRFELDGAQKDLYETVRLAMHARVRDEIAEKGMARSHIVILDALTKLRQICCDPRLIKLEGAKRMVAGAKLKLLLSMLEELIAEGKRVLIFSQFTSMLDLIAPELEKLAIPFLEIRGDTKDRTTPVQSFQSGSIPVLLLSLKAAGTGLNLTAADTVIHYDPWWNPAAEAQATDRAHRIGQDKPVFVFKLIASGTIEEGMLALQDKKRLLAESIFDSERSGSIAITEADIDWLFSPKLRDG